MGKVSRKCQVEELAKRTPESLAKSLIEVREKIEKLEGQMLDLKLRECGAQGKVEEAKREAKEAKEEAAYLSRVNEAMAKVLRKNGIAPMELIIRRAAKTSEKRFAEETSTAEFYCFSVCDLELEGIDEDFDDIFKDGVFEVIDKKTMKTIYHGVTEEDLEEYVKEEEQADD